MTIEHKGPVVIAPSAMLALWVLTRTPSDYPDKHVARLHLIGAGIGGPTDCHLVADTLDELRRHFERQGLAMVPRCRGDDPVIVEVWL